MLQGTNKLSVCLKVKTIFFFYLFRQCYREGGELFQNEDEEWNNIFMDATHVYHNATSPIYPGYLHFGLYQKQTGNGYLYHRNGIRVSHAYKYPNSLFYKERQRTCIAFGVLNSAERSLDSKYSLTDIDCKEKSHYVCSYNQDFMGFHLMENLKFKAVIDIITEKMTSTTCLALCKASKSHVSILLKERCICSKGISLTFIQWFT